MHINTFDHYQHLNSPVHQLDPRVKLVVTLAFILSNALLPDGVWLAFFASWLLVVLATLIGGFTMRFVLTRALVALPFALAAITTMFTIPGDAVTTFRLGSTTIIITDAGLVRFFSIMLRSWVSVQMAIVMTASTPFPDLVHAMRHLRMPDVLVSIVSFMYRYLFVLADEVMRMLRAREARSAKVPGQKSGGALLWRARIAGSMVGQLLLRSLDRSERVYNAMVARGYKGVMMTINPHVMRPDDWILGVVVIASLLGIQILSRS